MNTSTPMKAINVAIWPARTASAPSEAVTLRRSSTVRGAGNEPPFSRFTSSEAEAMVKLPSMIPWPPVMALLMRGAEITLPSRMMAKGLPMFAAVVSPKRRAPWPSKRKPIAGRLLWSVVTLALTRFSPETITRRFTR